MITTPAAGQKELEKLIVQNFPRDALMACEDAYYGGDEKGRMHAAIFASGHRPSAAGQVKHFHTNEAFHEALLAHGGEPSPLRGTRLVIGQFGIFNIARLNVPGHKWVNLRRSGTRQKLAELNRKYVQGDFFDVERDVTRGTIFILGVVDGIDSNGIAQLTQVMVALPAPDMRSWLYIRTMADVLKLYDQIDIARPPDNALPKLKKQPKKLIDDDKGN
jgi:hypothetical protein